MAVETYEISGMSCQHCVQAVTSEVTKLGGVARVDVDLGAGSVTVESEPALDRAAVATAVDEAGFELA